MTKEQNERDDEIVLAALPGIRRFVECVFMLEPSLDYPNPDRAVRAIKRLKRAGKVRYVRPNWERVA